MTIAEIIIARGIASTYSYLIPETLTDQITIGSPVTIPLGRTKCAGTVISINKKTPQTIQKKLKPILEIDPKRPTLPPKSIELINWFSHFYHTTPFKALQTIIGNRKYRPLNDTPKKHPFTSPFTLTPSQKNAISTILSSQSNSKFLLHGVTGSGKTEIYIQLAAAMQHQNQQTLILVPEIALTPQYMTLFTQRFGEKLSIIHSGLTPKNRDIAWNKINQNHSDIIIGPRSAIFTPIQRLGIIIIDEEHDPSYKQDTFPRYDIHHIAAFLAKQHNAKTVLGSATPRLTTLHEHLNQSSYIHLTDRATGVPLPKVHIIDMTSNEYQPGTIITEPLKNAIQTALNQNEKVMILINRRGYAPTIICQSCQQYLTCPECQLSYTYHQDKQLRCHRCDTTIPVTNTCPHCQKNTLQFSGLGIQKVELELNKQFNTATIMRLDKDTAKNAKDIDHILTNFKQKGDILLGTQLIAKGHDIPHVNLVGVLGIDTTLNLPDFRSVEQTFQLLTQVAGRAGRAQKQGEVYIQTHHKDHYVFNHSQNHDSLNFFKEEIQFRNTLHYPPFCTLINIIISSESQKSAQQYSQTLYEKLNQSYPNNEKTIIMPNKPCPFEKIRNHFRFHIVLKCNHQNAKKIKDQLNKIAPPPTNIRKIIDFDAWQLL